MQLKSIHFKHTGHFADLKIHFDTAHKPITLIIGDQASGKTTLLKHIYQALTWYPARLKDLRGVGVFMLDQDIMMQRLQSKVEVCVKIPNDIGQRPSAHNTEQSEHTPNTEDLSHCTWQLYKTLNARGIGIPTAETQQLEQLIKLYQHAQHHDPLQGLPMLAYYPAERFINEMNLLSKNNPATFQSASAYDLAPIPFSTFARFFEWLREISDAENAKTAHLLHRFIAERLTQDPDAEFNQYLKNELIHRHTELHAPCLQALKQSLHTIIPDLSDFYLQYQPKLQLMVSYKGQSMQYQQLSNTVKNWIALVGDIVRRLCILNPLSLYPCAEGDGILLIDSIDAHFDQHISQVILERLHHAFPRLQIIATGNRLELLEQAQYYQCYKLDQQQLKPINLEHNWQTFEGIYQSLLPLKASAISDCSAQTSQKFSETQLENQSIEGLFQQLQQLSADQKKQFLSLVAQHNDPSSSSKSSSKKD